MKIKATVLWVAAALVLAAMPALSIAQGAHSQFAVSQPQPAQQTQAPAIATRVPFANLPAGSSPIAIVQPQVIAPNPVFIPTQSFLPSQTVVVPNQVFAPTSVFAPTQSMIPDQFVFPGAASPSFQTPAQVLLPPTQLLVPGQTVIPTTTSQPVAPTQAYFGLPPAPQQKLAAPTPGTSRADVLQQFGEPIVTVGTSTNETLYFSDGTKVTLENGQVTGSK